MGTDVLPCAPIYECNGKKSIAVRCDGDYASDTQGWEDKRGREVKRKHRRAEREDEEGSYDRDDALQMRRPSQPQEEALLFDVDID